MALVSKWLIALITIQELPRLAVALLSQVLAIIGFQIIVIGLIADIEHQNRHVMEEILYRMRKGE